MAMKKKSIANFEAFRNQKSIDLLDCDSEIIFRSETRNNAEAKLTIAIPTYRRPTLLREALNSIRKLTPSIVFEVIVVDNDADDLSGAVKLCVAEFNDLPITLYRNSKNIGMFGNWNRCFLLSSTPSVSILNDDDMFLPNFLIQFQKLEAAVPKDWIYLQLGYGVLDERVDINKRHIEYSYTSKIGAPIREITLSTVLAGNTRAGSLAIVFDRASAISCGGFNPDEYPTADYCFLVRNMMLGKSAWEDPTPTAIYRVLQNESLKPEVMAGFAINEHRMLINCASLLDTPNWLVNYYAHIRVIASYYRLHKTWSIYPSKEILAKATGVVPKDTCVESISTRILTRLLRKLIN